MNNYVHFCVGLEVPTREDAVWIQTHAAWLQLLLEETDRLTASGDETIEERHALYDTLGKAEDFADAVAAAELEGTPPPALLDLVRSFDPLGDGDSFLGFELLREDDKEGSSTLYFEDTAGSANIDRAAEFLQYCLRERLKTPWIGMEWTCTGDQHRPGVFGGGAAFITAEKIEYISTSNWITQAAQAAKAQKTEKADPT